MKGNRMKRRSIFKTLPRFILVGIFNTLLGAGMMFLLYNLAGFTYWGASLTAYVIGSTISFFLNKCFTFQNHERSWKQVGEFIANVAVCYFLAYGAAKPVVLLLLAAQPVKLQENVAMFVGMGLYTVLNYFGQHFFVFRSEK